MRMALFQVIKGRDKAIHIALGSSRKFLDRYAGKLWYFNAKEGVVSPKGK